jgi:hypothetical protein
MCLSLQSPVQSSDTHVMFLKAYKCLAYSCPYMAYTPPWGTISPHHAVLSPRRERQAAAYTGKWTFSHSLVAVKLINVWPLSDLEVKPISGGDRHRCILRPARGLWEPLWSVHTQALIPQRSGSNAAPRQSAQIELFTCPVLKLMTGNCSHFQTRAHSQ